ncbi:hypothetical protein D3C86_1862760 [compost metagenome]
MFLHFAHHEHFQIVIARNKQDVARIEQTVLAQIAVLHERLERNALFFTVVRQHHVAPVSGIGQTACRVNRIQNRQRYVSDRLLARFIDFSGHIGFLRTERGDINVYLRIGDVRR